MGLTSGIQTPPMGLDHDICYCSASPKFLLWPNLVSDVAGICLISTTQWLILYFCAQEPSGTRWKWTAACALHRPCSENTRNFELGSVVIRFTRSQIGAPFRGDVFAEHMLGRSKTECRASAPEPLEIITPALRCLRGEVEI